MISVAILGILTAMAVAGIRAQMADAATTEATAMIQGIRRAQESFRAENGGYYDVSANLTEWYPMSTPNDQMYQWHNTAHAKYTRWRRLNVTARDRTRYGFACTAGRAGTQPDTPTVVQGFVPPTAVQQIEPWYVIQARGDVDGDGNPTHFVATSFTGEVVIADGGE